VVAIGALSADRWIASLTPDTSLNGGAGSEMTEGAVLSGQRDIRLNLAVGGGLDAESRAVGWETRFNVPRGAIFDYHRAQFEAFPRECRLRLTKDRLRKAVKANGGHQHF
jgi:hypothetical protein